MFYKAIVEDNKDPLKLGRVKVRIFGLHTDNKSKADKYEYLSVKDLPWAYPIYPVFSPTISGENFAFGVPEKGSIVAVIFEDAYKQKPFYLGTIPSIEQRPDYTKGFSDPDKVYPKKEWVGESSISRLARHENIEKTIIPLKQVPLTKPVLFTEPITPYNTVYPCNKVIKTKSGHIIELDDTPGAERIHIWHRSGTNIEIYPNGKNVKKNVEDDVTITLGDTNSKIKGNENKEVDGNMTMIISGNVNIQIKGTCNITSDGEMNLTSNTHMTLKAPRIDLNP